MNDNKNLIGKSINLIRNRKLLKTTNDKIQIDVSFREILELNNIDNDFIAVKTTGDGNCIYRSLPTILYQTEKYFKFIKLCHLFLLNEYNFYFRRLISDTRFEDFIERTSKENEFASSWNILACSILLNIPIGMISIDDIKKTYNQMYDLTDNKKTPVYLVYSKENLHFSPILWKESATTRIVNIKHDFYKNKKIEQNLNIKLNY